MPRTEEQKAERRRQYAEHREELLEQYRRYVRENQDKVRETRRKWRGRCVFYLTCGNELTEGERRDWHVDHVEPLRPKEKDRLPGSHAIGNLQLLCGPCNMKKHNSDPYAFAQQNGLLFCDIIGIPKGKQK